MNSLHNGASGLGLDSVGDLSSLLDEPKRPAQDRGPLMIPTDLIDEDSKQPRSADNPGFRPESIAELAASFGPKGPKTPLSLRDNPEVPNRYIINHGHRRYRACKVKGLTAVPAFIDNEHDDDDQIIENIQREGQAPREIADAIGRRLAAGKKKKAIADRWGKSASWVTQYVTLLDLPEPIAEVFNTGRANDVTVVNELVTAFKGNPKDVEAWLDVPTQEFTRGEVKLLREFLAEKNKDGARPRDPNPVDPLSGKANIEVGEDQQGTSPPNKERVADPDKLKKAIVLVEHDGRPARLILTKRPPADGYAWLKYEDDGQEFEANLENVQLRAVVEG
jgi:ParB family chromosome partitioning protein